MPLDAIVVLGCRVGPGNAMSRAAERRVARAAAAFHAETPRWVIASGGKRWHGVAEAEAFAARLSTLGVPTERVLKELSSESTRQNARFSGELLRAHGLERVAIVTCHWHMARALAAFRHYGVHAAALPAMAPAGSHRMRRLSEPLQHVFDRLWLGLERAGVLLLCLLMMASSGCRASSTQDAGAAPDASVSAGPIASAAPLTLRQVLAHAQAPALDGVMIQALTERDPLLREAAMRSVGRHGGPSNLQVLLEGLSDEAPRVIAMAAFGLGRNCAGRETDVSRALTVRAASLVAGAANALPAESKGARAQSPDVALAAIADALARCASDEGERSLRAWLKLGGRPAEAAAIALGELAQRRGRLEEQTFVALLDAARPGEAQLDSALAAFSRFTPAPGALRDRLLEVSEAALAGTGDARSFALRALGRAGAVDSLLVELRARPPDPRTTATLARELARAGEPGQRGIGELLLRVLPSEDAALSQLLSGESVGALLVVLDALEESTPKTREALLRLAHLTPSGSSEAAIRRAALVRCGAARLLTKNAEDPELLRCAPDDNARIGKLARIFVLDRSPIAGGRAVSYASLVEDPDAVVRQAALRLLAKHREVADAALLLTRALGAAEPGVVATAAEILSAHPERANSTTERRRQVAGDAPAADARLATALSEALTKAPANDVALRVALIDAAMSLKLLTLMPLLERSCNDANGTVRSRAERALQALGQPKRRCNQPSAAAAEPEELKKLAVRKTLLVFDTDAGELELELEPSSAPLAVTRVLALARSGFYDGTSVHRAIFGFVVQLGDPGGDGYGTAPRPALLSELGPAPFESGAVGLAESGIDSGSSQIFVTLGRFPHLDGTSARIGHAGPGWERLVVGDRIRRVTVRE